MQRPDVRLVIALLAAGALSFLIGFGFTQIVELVPCRGEGLVCNIDAAIGAYGVVIWAILGPLIFGLTLSIARTRAALSVAFAILLVPPIAFFLITQIEHTMYLGLEPQRQFRTLLVTLAPPALTVFVQYLILRFAVPTAPEPPP